MSSKSISLIILGTFIGYLVVSCAKSATSSYYYANKQIEHGRLDFHKTLRVNEYLNAFSQEGIELEENQQVKFQFDSFLQQQPSQLNKNIIQFGIKTRLPTQDEKRQPISLCFVLDISGSMLSDNKMIDALEALKNSLQELKEGDEFGLITFNDNANTNIPMQPITNQSRGVILSKIEQIAAGGGTDIEYGLTVGYKELPKFNQSNNIRMILLTDGISMVNKFEPLDYANAANISLPEKFQISVIGLGINVDENVLRKISLKGNGYYYFAENSNTLTSILREDLNSMVIPVLESLNVTFNFSNSVNVLSSYGLNDSLANEGVFEFNLKRMHVDDWRIFLFEVEAKNNEWGISPVQANVAYTLQNGEKIEKTFDYKMNLSEKDEQIEISKYVARNSIIYSNAKSMVKIGKLNENLDFDDALGIVDLQISNNKIYLQQNEDEEIKNELSKLNRIRNILLRHRSNSTTRDTLVTEVQKDSIVYQEESKLARIVKKSAELAIDALPGPWKTVAEIFLIVIE